MTTKEIMNQEVGYYYSRNAKNASYFLPIWKWFMRMDKTKHIVDQARQHLENGEDDVYQAIKATLPCTMFTCKAKGSKAKDDITELLPILVLDIDHIDDVDAMKKKVFSLPYVFLVSKSVSGHGVFALAYIAYPDKAKEQYKAMKQDLEKEGIILDKNTNNINRLRYMSYDNQIYIKPIDAEIEPYTKCFIKRDLKCQDSTKSVSKILGPSGYDIEWTRDEADAEDIYIEHSERWRLFNALSRITKDDEEFKKEWEYCCGHILEQNGHTLQYYKDLFDNTDWKSKLTGNEYIDKELLGHFGYKIKFQPKH